MLDLEDRFSSGMAHAAAATSLFRRELDRSGRDLDGFNRSSQKSEKSIDKLSGRLSILAQVAASVGPALIPVGAVGIPAVAGLASQLGFAALAGGTAIAAFQGVGDALKAMNKAHLEPTTANLEAAQIAMENISPAAQDFVRQLREMSPALRGLRDSAAAGMFPGLTEGLDSLESALPKVERIVAAVSGELGDIGASAGASLASDRWSEFFGFLETEAPAALSDLAAATGNVTHAMAELWMAFAPMNRDFSEFLVDSTAGLDEWASKLAETDGFAEFIAYVRANGPQVAETFGAIGNAVLQIVEASAPLGGPVLAGLEAFANAVEAIADSDLGTPIFGALAALSALNLAMRTTAALNKATFGGPVLAGMRSQSAGIRTLSSDWAAYSAVQRTAQGRAQSTATQMIAHRAAAEKLGGTLRSTASTFGKASFGVAGLAVATSGLGDKIGLTNTATLGLLGLMAGPYGAAIGATAGLTMDLAQANSSVADSLDQIAAAVARGDLESAVSKLEALEAKQKDLNSTSGFGDFFGDIGGSYGTSIFPAISSATLKVDGIDKARASVKGLNEEMADTAPSRLLAASLLRTNATARGTARQFITLGDSLDDSKVSLHDWIRQLEQQARALREFGNNARRAADRGLREGLIKALQEAGPEGARRMAQLANGTQAQIRRANQAWASGQRAVRTYTEAVLRVPMDRATRLRVVGAMQGISEVRRLQLAVAALRDRTITVQVRRIGSASVGVAQPRADGGPVYASGGQSRGPRDDDIPALLSHREYVQPVAAVDHYGERFMEAVRTRRFPVPQGYAEGGLVAAERFANGGQARRRRNHDDDDDRPRGKHLRQELERLRAAVAGNTKAVNKQTSLRDALASKRSDLSSTVTGKFTSDIFGESNVWAAGGGAGGAMGILKADIAKANAFKSILAGLRKNGLDGDALAEIAATGDVGKAQALLSMGKSGIGQFESVYNQRASAASAAGSYAGSAAFSVQQAAANKHLATLTKQNAAMTREMVAIRKELSTHPERNGKATGKAVSGAARKGMRK